MQQNQKYFALTDATGRMQNRFLLVSNLATEDPSFIIHGNERVLRARLSDAKFFYDQDRKKPLDARLSSLANVVYHNKLGSQLERVARIESLATQIAERLQRDADKARSAAHLAKADLLTDMVGEFPELQGIMGHYYALHDGESEAIAQAIEDHYKPKFSGDSLPRGPLGQIVALADKLETLAGMFAIGNIPTGDKDPFGLRRHALGVLRILGEAHLPLSLPDLVSIALLGFSGASGITDATLLKQQDVLLQFFYDRLRGLLRDEGAKPDEIEAIVSLSPARIDLITNQLEAVRKFAGLPEAPSLAAANKRIGNILKKVEESPVTLDPARLVEPAERILYAALNQLRPEVEKSYANLDYAGGLVALAALRVPVDAFFTEVMVMADDDGIRANRIALLRELHGLMNRIADLSKLVAS
jgi:glycyl-tRNA synthetase beta chain